VPIRRQCKLLKVSPSSYYYKKKGENPDNLLLMRRIDELFTRYPFLGYRKLTAILRREVGPVNSKRVLRLMHVMGLEAVYCKPNTSKPCPGNKVFPYLVGDMAITRANQVWAIDITYIRLKKGWVYLVAIMDWHSRYVLSWKLSDNMEVGFCLDALACALGTGQKPDVFNSDQGSQFTSTVFISMLVAEDILVSMDGRGSYHDNIFVERLWRSKKYEEVYLKEYTSFDEAQQHIGAYFDFYNHYRPHQALNYKTPAEVHFALAQNQPVDMMDKCLALTHIPTGTSSTKSSYCLGK
jgi:putative transposase